MGACGCGDFHADYQIQGSCGVVYAIGLYEPCDYCDTPLAIRIYRLSSGEAQAWGVDKLPEPPFFGYGPNATKDDIDAEAFIPILEPQNLIPYLFSDEDAEGIGSAEMVNAVRSAIWKTKEQGGESS